MSAVSKLAALAPSDLRDLYDIFERQGRNPAHLVLRWDNVEERWDAFDTIGVSPLGGLVADFSMRTGGTWNER